MPELTCASCRRALTSGRMGPVRFSACQPCGALWLLRDDLAHLLGAGASVLWRLAEGLRAAASGKQSASAPEPCPSCARPLQGVEYPSMRGVRLPACGACAGFWVDADLVTELATRLSDPSAADVALPPSRGKWRPPTGSDPGATRRRGAPRAPEPVEGECPGCGQPNAPDAAVCWACGRMLLGAVRGVCPRCSGHFHHLESENVEIGVCDGCGGVWLKRGRLGALMMQDWDTQDRLLHEVSKVRTGRIRKLEQTLFCPECKLLMFPTPMGMLTHKPVDTCPQCRAAFLDEGALAEILYSRRS